MNEEYDEVVRQMIIENSPFMVENGEFGELYTFTKDGNLLINNDLHASYTLEKNPNDVGFILRLNDNPMPVTFINYKFQVGGKSVTINIDNARLKEHPIRGTNGYLILIPAML